ncbi:indolepyruvate ferredoxin oxidoreductase family protein [Mycobacterium paraffinicum]|uniref:indolepyruvate ferredoxin oxidoreductase family protein n=1 Tax=Mycobacterium paraffinicum TaxID=53378 RepID=UPI0009395A89|nr:indolepyruvate ferredoxin oxidoreductase family protein [Mycobacterium paraffinicum]
MTETSVGSASPNVLAARYQPGSGPVLLTGVQAIARLLVEQHERDLRAGRRVATFVSGYQGSPLAGLDQLLAGIPALRTDHDVRLRPAVNEELAATAVWGSQMELPEGTRTHDGVIGVWYGKGPGLDRASDALRHAAMYGAHPGGGALALVGDDPAAKSSSVPAASERSLAALSMPIFFPRNANEIVAFGMYGVALSRISGCFSAMKLVADIADGLWTLDRDFSDFDIAIPTLHWEGRPWTYRQRVLKAPPDSVLAEADLYGPRWAMVEAFTAANDIDRIEIDPGDAWLGIIAVGSAYDATREALTTLGLTERDLCDKGIRVMRVGMPYPLDAGKVRRLARNVEQVLVVEDKTGFVESQVKEALFGRSAPEVIGKRGLDGQRLMPADGELTAARLIAPLRTVVKDRIANLAPTRPSLQLTVLPASRTAYFCSGCPHNRSTAVPPGSLAAGGIGCHTLVTMSTRVDSAVTGLTQMGGEGAQWIGQSPFTDVDHIFQNVGDGTYFHSGQLAVQACVAAGVNITYKILYNSAVAMTGAQEVEGGLSVPALTHKLIADGATRIIVCADEPQRHRGASFAPHTQLWHRDRLDEAQRALRDTKGVTVLIYDQQCAADARRKRKRGKLPARTTRVVINEAVCEGCGDCGVKSNCLSVQPVDTELGRKTRIDQTTCNTDYSCLDGNCPSFVTVELPTNNGHGKPPDVPSPPRVDEPTLPTVADTFNVFLAGIGGTGIVTVNQTLAMAALRSGLHAEGLDQTGLSQKAGPVTSHLRLSTRPVDSSNRVGSQSADCLLAFDLLTAVDAKNIGYAGPERTVAIASTSKTPTGAMVYDPSVTYPDTADLLSRLDVCTRALVSFDALSAAQRLFHDSTVANFLLVGAAYQLAALPIPAAAIEEAIRINGVAVTANLSAFRWGRVAVGDPAAFAAVTAKPLTASNDHSAFVERIVSESSLTGSPAEVLKRRCADLVAYQGRRTARRLVALAERTWRAERDVTDRTELSEAVIGYFFKLLAYKDEYEVARQLTDPAFRDAVSDQVPGARNVTFKLHPPMLKAWGVKSKIGFGPRTHFALRLLAKGRFLRGRALDPFGHTTMRRLERGLIDHYEAMINVLTEGLTADSYPTAVEAASAPDIVRGYEEVKLANVVRYVEALTKLGIQVPRLPSIETR